MKRIYRLQTLLELTIWGSAILIGVAAIAFIFAIATNDFSSIKIYGLEKNLTNTTVWEKIILGLNVFGYAIFFWGLFKLKELVSCFVKRNFFTPKTVLLSKEIGFLFLFSAIATNVPMYFYQVFSNENFRIGGITPDSFLFLIIIGIFFRTLGYLFQEAGHFQEDSELTV
ncbi:MAG TPA: DUF2975 domain-containing protein [Flavobacteriaceae bacterium]|nr:DUF2975 domain-containing protein [Flavobacteriaceae bacterium]